MRRLLALLMIATVMLAGCQLATDEVNGNGLMNQDELVGVVVTREHLDLFDMEAFLRENPQALRGGQIDTSGYEGRIYAQEEIEQSTTEDGVPCTTIYYNFDHVDGMALLNYRTQTILEDGSVLADTTVGDCSDGILDVSYIGNRMEGTIYVPEGAGAVSFFTNPVYQDSEGRVYLVAGTGGSTNELSGSMWHTITAEHTETLNGETATQTREIVIYMKSVKVTDRLAIIQMSGENAVLNRQEYDPNEIPESLTPMEGCAYILVEEYAGEDIKRTMIEPDDRYTTAFVKSDKTYCIGMETEILWPEA